MIPRLVAVELVSVVLLTVAGCTSPEDGRPRGDGPGADGGNYRDKPVHAPSKLDGTKPAENPFASSIRPGG
jgi:hypothetical protein